MGRELRRLLERAHIVDVEDCEAIQEIFQRHKKKMWIHFAPFLISYNLPPARSIHMIDIEGSLVLMQVSIRNGIARSDLLCTPVPYTDKITHWLTRLPDILGQEDIRILWVDEDEVQKLRSQFGEKLTYGDKGPEYIYEPEKVWRMDGHTFRDIRKRVRRLEKTFPDFMDLSLEHISECQELLRKWRSLQGRKNHFLLDWGYTRAALNKFHRFSAESLYGWCVKIKGKVEAFALAGPMTDDTANFFVAKTNPEVPGLSEYLRWKVLGELRAFTYVNDAGDLGIEGLRQHKMKMRPTELRKTFTATLMASGPKR